MPNGAVQQVAGTPRFPAGIDDDGSLGPLNPIVAQSTTLLAGDQVGIAKNMRDMIIALETKVGVTNSADTASLDYKVKLNPGWTLTVADFTVPAIGATVVVTVNTTAWAVVGEFVWVATAGGSPTVPMALQITAKTATTITLLNPPTAGTAPSGDANNLLETGSDSLLYLPPSAIQPTIWSAQLRSFNALGNPTMDVDQISGSVISAQTTGKSIDRWGVFKTGTMAISSGRTDTAAGVYGVPVPGTSFAISRGMHRIQLTTAQATLGATDNIYMMQWVEGPRFRELSMDLHNIQILCRSTVANLKFAIGLRDSPITKSLVKLCTLGAANTWALIQLPSLPIWPAGNWSANPQVLGYVLNICIAAGSSYTVPALDTWQSGNFIGAPGMDNFAAQAVNSTFDVAYIGHFPGGVCQGLLDCPFNQNLDDCLRYYQKWNSYAQAFGPVTYSRIGDLALGTVTIYSNLIFPKKLAKAPTMRFNGNVAYAGTNQVYLGANGTNGTVASANAFETGILTISLSAAGPSTGAVFVLGGWDADTGW